MCCAVVADDDSASDDDDKVIGANGAAPPPLQPQQLQGPPIVELPPLPELDISDAEKMELVCDCLSDTV